MELVILIDMTSFFMGKTDKSGRESVVIYNGKDVFGVKWHDWRMMVRELRTMNDPTTSYSVPMFYNLLEDPKEECGRRLIPDNLWVRYPASQVLIDNAKSLKKEPPIAAGTPDPYVPKK